MNYTKASIKICGIRHAQDARFCARIGVDFIGLVFYKPSPRFVTLESAQHIIKNLPLSVKTVGLFVNHSADEIRHVVRKVRLDVLQFHGDESNDFCRQFNRQWIKAIRIADPIQTAPQFELFPDADIFLLDAYHEKLYGGTGQTIDWNKLPKTNNKPIMLSGGLNPDNIQSAVHLAEPWAVDVSGGVESSKGVKSQSLIADFVAKIKSIQ